MARVSPGVRSDDPGRGSLSTLATGALGGLLATVTMTVYRLPIARSLPPTEEFWSQYGPGDERTESPVAALVMHLAYGTAAGAVFGGAFAAVGPVDRSTLTREATSLVLSTLYGIMLSAFGHRVLLRRLLAMDLESDEVLVFYVSHVIYGLVLGTWVGSRTDGST